MALQKYFYIFQDPNTSTNHLVFLDDFYKYFDNECKRQNVHVRRSYLLRSFKSVKSVDGKDTVSVREILRYCFNHFDDYSACKEIVHTVEKSVLFNKASTETEYVRSSLELYKLVAKTQLEKFEDILENVELDESVILTLVKDHKRLFTEREWKRIAWFEFHFARDISEQEISYEDLLKSKWNKYSSLLSFKKCRIIIKEIIKKHLKNRFLRRQAARRDESEHTVIGQMHLYHAIESQITSSIQEYYPEAFGAAIAFETDYDKKENGFSVIVEVTSDVNEEVYSYLCHSIKYDLQKRHHLNLKNVIFLSTDTIENYLKGDGVSRFRLRDDILLEKINNYKFYWENSDMKEEPYCEVFSDQPEGEKCDACYNAELPSPLTLKNFSITKEWHLDVPVEIQLLFGAFINTETVRRSLDIQKYLHVKLEKLYTLYDGLLNVHNKNYIGIFQQANSDELLYDYRNIKSVFNITAASGATASHIKAEMDWKKRADEDILYYNTYLKPHSITYHTNAGLETKAVSLRKCHTIFLLDNLVRLTTTQNPNRSENPSNQLCTLPLTIQGLSLDAAITERWHDATMCDGTYRCPCKKRITL